MSDVLRRRHGIFWSLAAVGLLLDLVSKYAVFDWLGYPSTPRPLLGELLRLHTARNEGTFFGLGAETGWVSIVLVILTVLMMAYVIYAYLMPPKESGPRLASYTAGLGMVLAGAAGNLYDRVVFRYVRDFIDVNVPDALGMDRWPTFNLADAWLMAGIALYVLAMMRMKKAEAGQATEEAAGQ
jgi:signal peptidase II